MGATKMCMRRAKGARGRERLRAGDCHQVGAWPQPRVRSVLGKPAAAAVFRALMGTRNSRTDDRSSASARGLSLGGITNVPYLELPHFPF